MENQEVHMEVEPREALGKNACRRLRRAGRIPGIVYGLDRPPFPVAISPKRLDEILKLESGRNTIFNLELKGQGKSRAAMIKEIQRDPVTELPVHVDFVRVDLKKNIIVEVPVQLLGTPVGVKTEGGMLEFIQREVEVECLPGRIPERVEVDVSELHMNQHVSVKDLPAIEGVRYLDDPETVLAVVAPPKAEEEEAPAEEEALAAEGAEPEVIKKGKEAEEESTGEGEGESK